MPQITQPITLHRANPARQAGIDLPLVALHSSASTGGQWKALAATLAGRRRVIAPDLPGYGAASTIMDSGGPIDLAEDAEAVSRSIGDSASAFHLVGHSYGGAVALKLALAQPWRVRSLTLIEPVAFHLLRHSQSDDDLRLYRRILGIRDRLRGAVAAGWPGHGMAAFVDFWNGPDSWNKAEPEQRRRLAAQAAAVQRNFALVLAESWPTASIARLKMPLLTIAGSESPAVTRRVTDIVVDAAGDVTAARIFGAGHMAPITHAASVNSLIERHVRLAEAKGSSVQRRIYFRRRSAAA